MTLSERSTVRSIAIVIAKSAARETAVSSSAASANCTM
jgi:hypothetical protein